jgi:hypothetical protein
MLNAEPELRAQLYAVAARFVLFPHRSDVDSAIRLACELLVRDFDTPATVSVASLPYGTTVRDSGPLVGDMLREQQVPLPIEDADETQRFDFLLKAFAARGISAGEMVMALLRIAPPWDKQTDTQRALIQLADQLDQQTTPAGKSQIIDAMRAVAADGAAGVADPDD